MSEATVLEWLAEISDPEIPTVDIVSLGIIGQVQLFRESEIHVEIIPTFAGCPAMHHIQQSIREKLTQKGFQEVQVTINRQTAWTTERISEAGWEKIKQHGLAIPKKGCSAMSLEKQLEHVDCPNCGSQNTKLMSAFGPTLCRAIHHCNACHETFEQFKPL